MMTGEACTFGMAGMVLISLLMIVALVLGIVALARYVFPGKTDDVDSRGQQSGGDFDQHPGK